LQENSSACQAELNIYLYLNVREKYVKRHFRFLVGQYNYFRHLPQLLGHFAAVFSLIGPPRGPIRDEVTLPPIPDKDSSMRLARRILPLLLLLFVQRTAFGQPAINWEGTIDAGKAAAARSNRFVLVFFTANWCPNCHRLENDLRNHPAAVAALEANFVLVKLNYDYFQNTARQYGVTRLPTTVILAPTAAGEVLAVIPEAMAVDEYLSKLNKVAADVRRRNAAVYAQIPANPAIGSSATVNPLRPSVPAAPPSSGARPEPVPAVNVASTTVSNPPAVSAPAAAAASATVSGQPPAPAPAVAMAPAPIAARAPETPKPATVSPKPMLALDGYCPVQLVENDRWQKGNKAWGMIHRGRLYLFAGPEEQRRFQADPDRYAPVSSGNDVVLALELGRTVPGFREHCAKFDGHVYLFASEATLKKFESNPPFYAERAWQAIRPAARTAALR
jgi:protein disulfide-isomerase